MEKGEEESHMKEDKAKYEKFKVKYNPRVNGSAYDIQHCIYCGKSFEDVDEVILHIKAKHMVIGSG